MTLKKLAARLARQIGKQAYVVLKPMNKTLAEYSSRPLTNSPTIPTKMKMKLPTRTANKLITTLLTLCVLLGVAVSSYAQPATSASAPSQPQAKVISLWNSLGNYTNVPVNNYFEVWYAADPYFYPMADTGSNVLLYATMSCCAAINLDVNTVNVSGCTNLHIDVFTPTGNNLSVRLVDSANHQADAYYSVASGVITNNGWIGLDMSLAQFKVANPSLNLAAIKQIGWIDNNAGSVTPADYYIDNVYFNAATNLDFTPPPAIPTPTNNAPTPTNSAASVLSMYNSSGTYTDHAGINWHASWSGSAESDYVITNPPGSTVKYMPGLTYVGVEFYDPNQIDTTGFTGLHFDVWTLDGNQIGVQLVSVSPTAVAQVYTSISTTQQWVGVNIPLSQFTAANPATVMSHLQQLLWVDNGGSGLQNGTFYIDNVYFYSNGVAIPVAPSWPTNFAPTPKRPASSVQSMYNSSSTYTDHAGINWYANWSGASGADFTVTNGANTRVVKSYAGLSFAGVEFYANPIDATAYSALHVDIWTPNANQLGVKLVGFNNPNQEAQFNIANTSGTITSNGWISLDIPLNEFTSINPALIMTNLQQLLWVDNNTVGGGAVNGTFYIDNVYFWTTNAVQSSIGKGVSIGWTASSTKTYQPQQSADNSTWANIGSPLTGNTITSVFQTTAAPFYRVLETGSTAVNGVVNGGFETLDATSPTGGFGWLANVGAGGLIANPVVVTNLDPHTGLNEIDLEGQGTGAAGAGPVALQNDIPVAAGSATLSFYAKGALMNGGANPMYNINWYAANNDLTGSSGFQTYSPITSGYAQKTINLTAPANTTHAQIQFLLAVGAGTGDPWLVRIDDVALTGAGTLVTNALPTTVQPALGVSWLSGKGLTYTVQSKANLTSAAWSNLGGNVIGTGTNSVSDLPANSAQFYRVLEVY